MNYIDALDYISTTHRFGMKLGFERIEKLLELLDNPHKNLNIIHVAGTNGKGSTCSFISEILKESGYKIGLYTSPFLESFTERIRVNKENIDEDKVAEITSIIKEKIEIMKLEGFDSPTEFEIVTAMAFYHFNYIKVDYVVLEVGLGGRFDATNVIEDSLVSVITPISIDHVNVLGDSLDKIAYEKGGIIKENGTVILYKQTEIATNIIKDICKDKNAKLIEVDFDEIKIIKSDIESQIFDYKNYKNLEISLIGNHQIKNSIVAINCIENLFSEELNKVANTMEEKMILSFTQSMFENALRLGLKNTTWAGRIEKLNENIIIDGAHNEDGAKSLKDILDKNFEGKKLNLLIGMLEDKDINSVIEILVSNFQNIITTNVNNSRNIDSKDLSDMIKKYNESVISISNLDDALEYALNNTKEDEILICCGSLYLVGEIRSKLK
ncbi:MAG: folylpolyglutamate synthase/dihydrofolate synthase family protein [Peptostreptococcaceae bacterium]